jgi:hypothetical protein
MGFFGWLMRANHADIPLLGESDAGAKKLIGMLQ